MKHDSIGFALSQVNEPLSRRLKDIQAGQVAAVARIDDVGCVAFPPDQRASVQEKDIRTLLKLRRRRELFFGRELFADPAWDILLELYARNLGQQRISVGTLSVAAAVPPTTALRWISSLEKMGFLKRVADPTDGRRNFVELSGQGLDVMNRYFQTVPTVPALI